MPTYQGPRGPASRGPSLQRVPVLAVRESDRLTCPQSSRAVGASASSHRRDVRDTAGRQSHGYDEPEPVDAVRVTVARRSVARGPLVSEDGLGRQVAAAAACRLGSGWASPVSLRRRPRRAQDGGRSGSWPTTARTDESRPPTQARLIARGDVLGVPA